MQGQPEDKGKRGHQLFARGRHMLCSEIGYFIEPRESSKDTINPGRDFTQIHLHSLKGTIFIYSRMTIEKKNLVSFRI